MRSFSYEKHELLCRRKLINFRALSEFGRESGGRPLTGRLEKVKFFHEKQSVRFTREKTAISVDITNIFHRLYYDIFEAFLGHFFD